MKEMTKKYWLSENIKGELQTISFLNLNSGTTLQKTEILTCLQKNSKLMADFEMIAEVESVME